MCLFGWFKFKFLQPDILKSRHLQLINCSSTEDKTCTCVCKQYVYIVHYWSTRTNTQSQSNRLLVLSASASWQPLSTALCTCASSPSPLSTTLILLLLLLNWEQNQWRHDAFLFMAAALLTSLFLWTISVGLWSNRNQALPAFQNPKTPYIKGAGPPHLLRTPPQKGLSRNNYSI